MLAARGESSSRPTVPWVIERRRGGSAGAQRPRSNPKVSRLALAQPEASLLNRAHRTQVMGQACRRERREGTSRPVEAEGSRALRHAPHLSVGLNGPSALPPHPVIPGVDGPRSEGGDEMVARHHGPRGVCLFGDSHVTSRGYPEIGQALERRRPGAAHRRRREAFDDVTAPNRPVFRLGQRRPLKAKLASAPAWARYPPVGAAWAARSVFRFPHRSRRSLPIRGQLGKGDTLAPSVPGWPPRPPG